MAGKIYVVATPIGNLNDLTPRMKQAFEEADFIAAEDTRVSLKLLNHLDIKKPLVRCVVSPSNGSESTNLDAVISYCDGSYNKAQSMPRLSGPSY